MSLKQEIAPNGVLRFAINVGNSVLTEYDTQTGKVGGITVEIARDLAHKLDLPLELKIYRSARTVVQDASKDIWDIGFIARDPKRSAQITFTSPYILIEGCYLVRSSSNIATNADVDHPSVTVAVGNGAAYDLFLTRHLQKAQIQRTDGTLGVLEMFEKHHLPVAAGIRQPLADYATQNDHVRLLPESFMFIEQAIATPAANTSVQECLQAHVHGIIQTGYVKSLIERFGKTQASVPDA
ncbi:transporter substrate-binding domain-containing protein [Thalassospira lucentensis]|uniref:transporter substrate-binding domain-containing protein n=1 Tax=Thalassospira lucentensis TaxID=168935 RepID=UPI003D271EB3|tara:strand:+ start:90455 stop:91171 length:717 start_codon:yes stop_codon:yes gene_type:complete